MIILDTNVVSEPMRRNSDPAVAAWLDQQAAETLYSRPRAWRNCWLASPSCRRASEGEGLIQRQVISVADAQITAIATVHGFTVATRDPSPFIAAGVRVINPWDEG